jgi:hypothetical protein
VRDSEEATVTGAGNTEDVPVIPHDGIPGPQGPPGPPGATGQTGPTGRTAVTGISWRTRLLGAGLLFLLIVIGAGNLLSGYIQNRSFQEKFNQQQEQQRAAQEKASAAFDAQLCAIFLPIAHLKAPPGTAVDPSRLFEQQLEAKLALIAPVLRCK